MALCFTVTATDELAVSEWGTVHHGNVQGTVTNSKIAIYRKVILHSLV